MTDVVSLDFCQLAFEFGIADRQVTGLADRVIRTVCLASVGENRSSCLCHIEVLQPKMPTEYKNFISFSSYEAENLSNPIGGDSSHPLYSAFANPHNLRLIFVFFCLLWP